MIIHQSELFKLQGNINFNLLLVQDHIYYFLAVSISARYGYERSGLIIAACYMLEKLKVDREVDVFQAVKQVRITRPELVTSLVRNHSIIRTKSFPQRRKCFTEIKCAFVLVICHLHL